MICETAFLTTAPPTTTVSTPEKTTATSSNNNLGAILGGAIGVFVLALLAFLLVKNAEKVKTPV